MSSAELWSGINSNTGLLIDTNLLVLFIVGSVNPDRIAKFKRTRQYSEVDYQLLLELIDRFGPLYTLAHVMAEVSNLTDLADPELLQARYELKEALTILQEPAMASVRAAKNEAYERLGLVDAAIATLAREFNITVLTDDLDLYMALSQQGMAVLNFTHLRARRRGM